MTDYEVSAVYIDALLRALGPKALPAVLEVLDASARPMVANAWSESWHPAGLLEALGEAVVTAHGAQALENLAYTAMKDRFGSIVLPMLKRSLETTQRSPGAILSKLGSLVEMAMRGLEIVWQPEGQGGVLQIVYPRAVAPHIDHSWRGVLRFIFEVTQPAKGVEFSRSPDGTTLEYRLSW